MKSAGFRRVALSMPFAVEGAHMGHADFRVAGKVFASLPPPAKGREKEERGMVRLGVAEQRRVVKEMPGVFEPAAGAWGRQGCTYVRLGGVDRGTLGRVMEAAWRRVAPKELVEGVE
ncbi:MAG: MmcQ/YjbR family DNA-binding protein [Phycisphaeraceae bacterium]|nr:MmcQ/YjbR family DNA-binding protein [Phycisphaeraceae bacterium]